MFSFLNRWGFFSSKDITDKLIDILAPMDCVDGYDCCMIKINQDPTVISLDKLHCTQGCNGIIIYNDRVFYHNQHAKYLKEIHETEFNQSDFNLLKKSCSDKFRRAESHELKLISSLTGLTYLGNKQNKLEAIAFIKKNSGKSYDLTKDILLPRYTTDLLSLCITEYDKELLQILLANTSKLPNSKVIFNCLLRYELDAIMPLIEFYKNNVSPVKPQPIDDFFHEQSTYEQHFDTFPRSEIWRMFIDAEKQRKENGWLDFEAREPGYIQAMLTGWDVMVESLNEPVSISLIKKLHAACSNNVNDLNDGCIPGSFRDNQNSGVGLEYGENASVDGILEIMQFDLETHYAINKRDSRLDVPKESLENLTNYVEKIVAKYNYEISQPLSAESKLKTIIELIVSLERTHPFVDANTRTFSMLLLNKELLRNGFSPTILNNPNRFAGLSRAELYNEVVNGMTYFQQVKLGNTTNLGISSEQVNQLITSTADPSLYKSSHDALENYQLRENYQANYT